MKKYLNNFKIGFSLFGFSAFVLQELPYIPWVFCPPADNPLTNNNPANIYLGVLEQGGGIITVALLILIVRKTVEKISFKNVFFIIAVLCIAAYFVCWICYFAGITNVFLIVFGLSAVVPVYYLFTALWLKNDFAVFTSILFFVGHTWSNMVNYLLNSK